MFLLLTLYSFPDSDSRKVELVRHFTSSRFLELLKEVCDEMTRSKNVKAGEDAGVSFVLDVLNEVRQPYVDTLVLPPGLLTSFDEIAASIVFADFPGRVLFCLCDELRIHKRDLPAFSRLLAGTREAYYQEKLSELSWFGRLWEALSGSLKRKLDGVFVGLERDDNLEL